MQTRRLKHSTNCVRAILNIGIIATEDFFTRRVWYDWAHQSRDVKVNFVGHMSRPSDATKQWMAQTPYFEFITWVPEQSTSWGGPGNVLATMDVVTKSFKMSKSSKTLLISQDCVPLVTPQKLTDLLHRPHLVDKSLFSVMRHPRVNLNKLEQESVLTTPYLIIDSRHWQKVMDNHSQNWKQYVEYHGAEETKLGTQFGLDEIYLATMISRYYGRQMNYQNICWTQWDDFNLPFRGTYVSEDFIKKNLVKLSKGQFRNFGKGWLLVRKCKDADPLLETMHQVWQKSEEDSRYFFKF
jgi:hypothetical protein